MQESSASLCTALKAYETMRTASAGTGILIVAFFVGMLIATNNGFASDPDGSDFSFMSRSRIHWDRFQHGMPTLVETEVGAGV
jgi:hypothetical protein